MIDADRRNAIYQLYKEGMAKREISRRLSVSLQTVRSIIAQKGVMPVSVRKDKISVDKALLRRQSSNPSPHLQLLTGSRSVTVGNQSITLTDAEFELLSVLVKHPNRVLSRDFIMECLSGIDRDPYDRSIDVRVTRLRHKIEDDPAQPRFVRTVWGVGYQFTPEESPT